MTRSPQRGLSSYPLRQLSAGAQTSRSRLKATEGPVQMTLRVQRKPPRLGGLGKLL